MEYEIAERNCPICGLDDSSVMWVKEYTTKYSKTIVDRSGTMIHGENHICHNCGMVFEKYPMTEKVLNEFYEKDETGISPYRATYSYTMNSIYLHYEHTLEFCRKALDTNYFHDWLDIGSGDPWITNEMGKNGISWSWDPGFDHPRNFKIKPQMKFDLITCMNMLEHVYDPIAFLTDIHSLLRPSGNLIICVPYIYTRSVTMHKDQWFSNAHIHHFDAISLKNACSLSGWKVVKFDYMYEEMGEKIYVHLKKNKIPIKPVYHKDKDQISRCKSYIRMQNDIFEAWENMNIFNNNI